MQTNVLPNRAVIVQLSTSSFTGNKKDKRITGQIEQVNHISETDRVSGRKYVMKGKRLDAVKAGFQRVRQVWENNSAPWLDGGFRIIPARSVIEVKQKIDAAIRECEPLIDALIAERDQIVAHDKSVLNGAFNEADYPNAHTLRAMFQIGITLHPVAVDFRCDGLDKATRDEIQREANAMLAERTKDAKRELLARVAEKLGSLVSKLATHKPGETRFHDSTITNVSEVCAQVDASNFDEDQAISRLVASVEKTIKGIDPEMIKDSEAARKDAKIEAENQLASVQDAMKAFC